MATIKDVAKKAGVSVATVSRYINKSGYVGEKTATNLSKVIKELNYEINEVARSLQQQKSRLIGLLLPDISNPFFTLLAKGVEDGLNGTGYTLMFGNVEEDLEKLNTYLSTFNNNNVTGVISASYIENSLPKDTPYISVDRVSSSDKYSVSGDNYLGGKLQAEAILETEFKKIVVLAGPSNLTSTKARLKGISEVLTTHEIPFDIYYAPSYDYSKSLDITQDFLKKYQEADTIIAFNDLFAMTVMKELQRKKIQIPEDIQIIGYDNISFSSMMNPRLTTVAQFSYRQGLKAAELLLDIIDNNNLEHRNVVFPVELIEGNSLRKKFNS